MGSAVAAYQSRVPGVPASPQPPPLPRAARAELKSTSMPEADDALRARRATPALKSASLMSDGSMRKFIFEDTGGQISHLARSQK